MTRSTKQMVYLVRRVGRRKRSLTEVRGARVAIKGGMALFERSADRLVRNGGYISRSVFRNVRTGSASMLAGVEHWGNVWENLTDRGLKSSTPLEVMPVVGTIILGFNTVKTCTGRN